MESIFLKNRYIICMDRSWVEDLILVVDNDRRTAYTKAGILEDFYLCQPQISLYVIQTRDVQEFLKWIKSNLIKYDLNQLQTIIENISWLESFLTMENCYSD